MNKTCADTAGPWSRNRHLALRLDATHGLPVEKPDEDDYDGGEYDDDGLDVGLFSQNAANNADVVRLMANEVPCGDYKSAQSEMGLWYIDKGVGYTCRIGIPPEPGRFIGQITVGWATEPEDLEKARAMLQIAAVMLSKSKH